MEAVVNRDEFATVVILDSKGYELFAMVFDMMGSSTTTISSVLEEAILIGLKAMLKRK